MNKNKKLQELYSEISNEFKMIQNLKLIKKLLEKYHIVINDPIFVHVDGIEDVILKQIQLHNHSKRN